MRQGEGREDELGIDLQGIEDTGADFRVEGTRGHPPLRSPQDIRPDVLPPVGLPEVREARHQLGRAGAGAFEAQGAESLAQPGVCECGEPVGRLHQMTVGVEDPCVHGPPNVRSSDGA